MASVDFGELIVYKPCQKAVGPKRSNIRKNCENPNVYKNKRIATSTLFVTEKNTVLVVSQWQYCNPLIDFYSKMLYRGIGDIN